MNDSDLKIQGLSSSLNLRLDKVRNFYKIGIIKEGFKENI
jgi:hypothetical protein